MGSLKRTWLVYDEAQHLQAEHVAASGPARLVEPEQPVLVHGFGWVDDVGERLADASAGVEGGSSRFAYVEHTAEQVKLVDGRLSFVEPEGVLDREAWARANPAYGSRITDESLLSLYDELGPELFARECLCIWDPEPSGAVESVIPKAAWQACEHEHSEPVGDVVLAVDVAPNRDWGSIAWAGESSRGGMHVEVLEHRRDVKWLIPRLVELQGRWSRRSLSGSGRRRGRSRRS